jgi:hypothetical protein
MYEMKIRFVHFFSFFLIIALCNHIPTDPTLVYCTVLFLVWSFLNYYVPVLSVTHVTLPIHHP